MAEKELHEVLHEAHKSDSQTIHNEPVREYVQHPDPPPGYTAPPYPYYPPQPQPCHQGYFGPQPQAGQGYVPGYQPLVNQPQTNSTTTNTTVVVQPSVVGVIRPYNYLVHSYLTTFFCCPVLGIIGIIFGCLVDAAYDDGDYARARSHSVTARTLNMIALSLGLLGFLIFTILMAI